MARKKEKQFESIKTFPGAIDQGPAVERVTDAEVIPNSIDAHGLPDDLTDSINDAIYDFMTYECKPPIDDMRKAPALVWSACCMYIGSRIFKNTKLLHDVDRERTQGGKVYDYNKIAVLVDVWAYYCAIYSKAPLYYNFFNFCGLYDDFGSNTAYKGDNLTPERLRLRQKLSEIQQSNLAMLISDGRQNPTGVLAILNHWHGWSTSTVTIQHETKQAISAVELPKLGGDS